MAKRGRPPILQNQKVIDQIIKNIESGLFVETSAALAGIGKTTFYSWLKTAKIARAKLENKEKISPLEVQMITFADRVMVAQAQAEKTLTDKLDASESWQATAWRLKHLFPKRYGDTLTVDGEVKETVKHKLTDTQLKALGDALAESARTLSRD
jgi:hypothetical protein